MLDLRVFSALVSLALALLARRGPISDLAIVASGFGAVSSSDSSSDSVASSELLSVSSSLLVAGGGTVVGLFCKNRLWKGF